jgi:hypothetical protein
VGIPVAMIPFGTVDCGNQSRFGYRSGRGKTTFWLCIKGWKYEIVLPRVRWMPGSDESVGNVLGIEAVEHHRFERRAGRYEATVISAVRKRIRQTLRVGLI